MSPHSSPITNCLYCGQASGGAPYCCSACHWLDEEAWVRELPGRETPAKWQAFDRDEIWPAFNHGSAGEKKFRLYIEGLQCASCVHLLEKLPEYDSRVRSVRVRYGESDLFFELSADGLPGWTASLIEDMGYQARFLSPDESAERPQKEEDRQFLRRLAVAGACSGNIMLFTVPVYAGLAGSWKIVFHGLSFLLFLPVLTYSAAPFFKGAWSSLKTRSLSVDLPLATAMLGGFFASVINLLRGSDAIYLDSTAGFLFLILISRWFLRKSHRRWTATDKMLPWNRETSWILRAGQKVPVLTSLLKTGDRLVLEARDFLPADAVLRSPSASFETSFVSGEAFPKTIQEGQNLLAGSRALQGPVEVELLRSPQESEMAKVWKQAQHAALFKNRRMDVFDRSARILLAVVLGLGLLTLVCAPILSMSWEDAFQRALALWIVACPCALAFGGPLAYAAALRKAARSGLLVKDPEVFDRLTEVKRIAFDKTGTLTEGRLVLTRTSPSPLPPFFIQLVLGLERTSLHPVAQAFRETWAARLPEALKMEQVHEVIGSRVFGIFDHKLYSLQSGPSDPERLNIELRQEKKILADFDFEDLTRPEAAALIRELSPGYELFLLSGDHAARAHKLGRDLGLSPERIFGDFSPEDKARFVETHPGTLMIGDGANDGPALAKAHVGVAVNGALKQSLAMADILLLRPGLAPLRDLLQLSKKVRKIIRRNLAFALAYNAVAGSFALAGMMNPLIAALLMPLSSLLILASTWEGSR